MALYIDADKLIIEIERMRKINRKAFEADHIASDVFHGRAQAINHLSEFIDTLKQEQPEVDLEKEIDFFLYGTYTPERFPNTMQVRDEHTGLKVNDWKWWVNNPEYKVEFARHFYELGLNARKEE